MATQPATEPVPPVPPSPLSTRTRALWWLLGVGPMVLIYGLTWLPVINGPHLWFGLPSILVWTTLPGSVLIAVVLVVIEKTRPDQAHQDELDRLCDEGRADR